MKASIRIKLLVLCILLVLVATISMSIVYYTLTKQSIQRESQERIQIAFEIILDDIAEQLHIYTQKFDEFLQRDNTLYLSTQVYNRNPDQVGMRQYLVSQLMNVGYMITTDHLALYGTDKRLLAVYQRPEEQEPGDVDTASETGLDQSDMIEAELPADIAPSFEGDIPEQIVAELFSVGQQLGIRITAPVGRDKDITGVLIGAIFFTQPMVKRYTTLSKTEVNFFANTQLSLGTLPAQGSIEAKTLRQMVSCQEILGSNQDIEIFPTTLDNTPYYQGQCTLGHDEASIGSITVSLSQEVEQQEISKLLNVVLLISGIVLAVAFGLSILFSRKTIHAIHNIVNVIAAASEGDLRPVTIATTRDEIGMLARKLNQMVLQLRMISGQVQEASYAVNSTADTILQEMETLIHYMEQQSASIDHTTVLLEKIRQFIATVAHNTNDLLAAAAQILSSVQETRASIEEVTVSTGSLTTNLHLISTSVDQVNQAVKRISENTEQLETVAQHTETEIQHIDQSLQEVSHNANRTQELAKETMEAATQGQISMEASMQGMTELKAVVADTAQIIHEVNSWGERVSSILDIVDEITEQTSLLSLNASIISAQAGVHGRGFVVVADEIKELATRTKTSTKEIGTLIHELQMKTEEGVTNTEEGLRKADQGMELANTVKGALTTILERATRSSNRAENTAQVIQQTVERSRAIRASTKNVTERVSHIRTAIQAQEQDIEQVVSAVGNISGMADQVNRANLEQKQATLEIERSMGEVTEQFDHMSEQTETLQQNSDQITAAMRMIGTTTEQIFQNATNISDETVKNLVHQSDVLQKIVTIFKV